MDTPTTLFILASAAAIFITLPAIAGSPRASTISVYEKPASSPQDSQSILPDELTQDRRSYNYSVGAVRESADIQDVNHFYDADGKHVFTQIIWWELRRFTWQDDETCQRYFDLSIRKPRLQRLREQREREARETDYHIIDWRLSTKCSESVLTPAVQTDGQWLAVFYDVKTDCLRAIRSRVFTQTYTLYDPDLHDKTVMPERYRRLLRPASEGQLPLLTVPPILAIP